MTESITKADMISTLSTKKSKLQPQPEIGPEDGLETSVCKRKTEKSSKNTNISTSKKLEVTFAEDVAEIENKENEGANYEETNLFHISPSKHSLKSVKEHIKTPFSKIKEGEEEGSPLNKSLAKAAMLSGKKFELSSQPDFNNVEISVQSVKKENASPMIKSTLKSSLKRINEVESDPSGKKSAELIVPSLETKDENDAVAASEKTDQGVNISESAEISEAK
jgi:hypothetical protein